MNENKITEKDILHYLNYCYPTLAKEKCMFLGNNTVKIANHKYTYQLIGNKLILVETKRKNNKEVFTVITPELKKKNSKSIKTKKGKIKQGKKVLFMLGSALILTIITGMKNQDILNSKKENEEILMLETSNENELVQNIVVAEEEKIDTQKEYKTIKIDIEVDKTDHLGLEKRYMTEEKYGDLIAFYANRRGLDKEFLINLFTRERYGELNKVPESVLNDIGYQIFDKNEVDVEEKIKSNIGQLTRAICGEEIISPVFENQKLVGYDKIYVLPPSYDNYEIEDLKTMKDSSTWSEEDKKKIEKAYELQQEGTWEIYKRKEAFYDVDKNINVSTAYLAYLINKKKDFIKGVMSYNAGPSAVKDSMSYESILSGEVEAYDPYYIPKILQYAEFENEKLECFIEFQNEEIIVYQFHNTKELEEYYEKENGYSL